MQKGSKDVIRMQQDRVKEHNAKIADMRKRMNERGMELFQENFLNAPFGDEPSARWHLFARRALLLDSPKALQMSKEKYFQAIAAKRHELTNEQFAGLSNALETKGPKAIGASTKVSFFSADSKPEYDLLLEEANELIRIYNLHQEEIRKEIEQIIEQEFAEEAKALQTPTAN